jgi:phytoene dehydrogenase-like protein
VPVDATAVGCGLYAQIVGAGPNGLAAALTLARAGVSVQVYEGADTPGGGCRTAELTLPGYLHDVCSAVHPLLAASPFFAPRAPTAIARPLSSDPPDTSTGPLPGVELANAPGAVEPPDVSTGPLAGVELANPPVAFAHPLDGGGAVAVYRSVDQTAAELGADGWLYRRLLGALERDAQAIVESSLAPVLAPPAHPLAMARFGAIGLWPAAALAKGLRTRQGRALLAGLGAHSMQPLSAPGTGAFALLLGVLAHAVGWPVVRGGSARIVDALVAEIEALGGRVHSGRRIELLEELEPADCTLLDVAPRGLLGLAGSRLSGRYARALERFRHGPGVFKLDWALSGPVPWQNPACRQTATLHVGGAFAEIARSEADAAAGRHSETPFCIVVQPCVVDTTRAPAGHHTLYAYCHVPNGSTVDMTERIEGQIERFAPGFRDLVLARGSMNARQIEAHDPNFPGGDINCGAATLRQTIFRPLASLHPYNTPLPGVYLCSSATPPGGGVHGMCGVGAAQAALRDLRVSRTPARTAAVPTASPRPPRRADRETTGSTDRDAATSDPGCSRDPRSRRADRTGHPDR